MKTAKKTPRTRAKKTTTAKKTAQADYRTLRINKPARSFLSAEFTNQSLYWLILGVIIVALGGWIIHLQVTINGIYDKIDQNQIYYDQIDDLDTRVRENRKAIEQGAVPQPERTE